MSEREEAIEGIMASGSGHSREWAESFLLILGSGLRRRGLLEGEPLPQEDIARHVAAMFPPVAVDPISPEGK